MITFRKYLPSDTSRLVHLANNKNVSRYLIDTFPHPYTISNAEWWIATGSKENNALTWVIEYQSQFVGSIGITPQTGWRSHIAEIGYWLGQAFWGRGIATKAVNMMTVQAFTLHPYQKLIAPVLGSNTASMRVLQKNGYVLEGKLRNEVVKNNTYHDIYYYAKHKAPQVP